MIDRYIPTIIQGK